MSERSDAQFVQIPIKAYSFHFNLLTYHSAIFAFLYEMDKYFLEKNKRNNFPKCWKSLKIGTSIYLIDINLESLEAITYYKFKGVHFGINACRACAAFFRRTIYSNRVYKCRFNGNCSIDQKGNERIFIICH